MFLGLTGGEIFIVSFIFAAIMTARFWPAFGERLVSLLGARK